MVAATGAVDPTTGTTTGGTGGGTGPQIVARGPAGGAVYDMHTTTSTARVDQQCTIGELDVDIDGGHSYYSDLVSACAAPTGPTTSSRATAAGTRSAPTRCAVAQGLPSQGNWTVSVADTVRADSGQLRGFTLTIRCR